MRRSGLAILAILSLALLPILLSSYAVGCIFWIDHRDTSRRFRQCAFGFRAGFIEFRYDAGVSYGTRPPGWDYDIARGAPSSLGQVRLNLWRFHAGPREGSALYDLIFPVWLPALACTIVPLLWLRRRRRINRRGFAIEPSEPSNIADATATQE
ncbi:MAG TPA: hypothetical protein VFE58_19025 [Tepidisphaeraceae bacterium]|jgi:hypothetical protein|nr:hypothetical protein [Tepidisphaeraceae bacterium]